MPDCMCVDASTAVVAASSSLVAASRSFFIAEMASLAVLRVSFTAPVCPFVFDKLSYLLSSFFKLDGFKLSVFFAFFMRFLASRD